MQTTDKNNDNNDEKWSFCFRVKTQEFVYDKLFLPHICTEDRAGIQL